MISWIRSGVVLRLMSMTFILALVAACSTPECDQYRVLLESDLDRSALEQWADEVAFRRELAASDYELGYLSGPGRHGALRDASGSSLPDALLNFTYWIPLELPEVRPLGGEKARPDAIFVGRKSFQGLVIARGALEDVIKTLQLPDKSVAKTKSERIGIVCYSD